MISYQICSYNVTDRKNLPFLHLKSYCPLNFEKIDQTLWSCCIPNRICKEDNLRAGRICPPPPSMWNRITSTSVEIVQWIIYMFSKETKAGGIIYLDLMAVETHDLSKRGCSWSFNLPFCTINFVCFSPENFLYINPLFNKLVDRSVLIPFYKILVWYSSRLSNVTLTYHI